MQLKPVVRVIAVILINFYMVAFFVLTIPADTVLGQEQARLSSAPVVKNFIFPQSNHRMQVGITDTTSTTPTTSLTETIDLTATKSLTSVAEISPTSTVIDITPTPQATAGQKTPEATPLLGYIKNNPLVPLGISFVVLVSALTVIFIAAQRQAKKKVIVQNDRGGTAPLQPKSLSLPEKAYLQLKEQPEIKFPLAIDDIRIGRSPDNTIVITPEMSGFETVSRYHARLYRAEKWILEDIDSTNGIYINGQRTGRNYLRPGWEIGIGGVIFTFYVDKVEE